MVSKTLNANPKLRTELEAALKSTDAARKDTARDIIDIALNAGLNEVFKLIHSWLEDETPREDLAEIRQIVDGLAALGVAPEWVQEMRPQLKSGRIEVPPLTNPCTAEIILAALLGIRAQWSPSASPGTPTGKGFVPVSTLVEPAPHSRESVKGSEDEPDEDSRHFLGRRRGVLEIGGGKPATAVGRIARS